MKMNALMIYLIPLLFLHGCNNSAPDSNSADATPIKTKAEQVAECEAQFKIRKAEAGSFYDMEGSYGKMFKYESDNEAKLQLCLTQIK